MEEFTEFTENSQREFTERIHRENSQREFTERIHRIHREFTGSSLNKQLFEE
jgi:hypothetical protein